MPLLAWFGVRFWQLVRRFPGPRCRHCTALDPEAGLLRAAGHLDPSLAEAFEGIAKQLAEAAAEDRRPEAVELYMTKVMQMPAPAFAQMRTSPMWPGLEELAHKLSYDLLMTARGPSRLEQAPSVRSATLVMDGGASAPWMREAIRTLAS